MRFTVRSSQHTITTTICYCLLLLYAVPSLAGAFEPMLPRVYSSQVDITGWLMSEKLDGVRGYWDGEHLYSKNGHLLHPPAEFIRDLPSFALEGELWGGHGTFEQTIATVQRQQPHSGWLKLKYAIFDAPTAPGGFTQRIAQAQRWFKAHPSKYAFIIKQSIVRNTRQLQQQLTTVEHSGGEGLIVRQANALYVHGRNRAILKVKSYQDDEATVLAHLNGHGRNSDKLGALLVQLADGTKFRLGSGFSDKERAHPPAIGAIITFKYYGKYPSGIPKFASFMRVRKDSTF